MLWVNWVFNGAAGADNKAQTGTRYWSAVQDKVSFRRNCTNVGFGEGI